MDEVMVVCKLENIRKLVAVPIKFIYELDFAKSLNYRLNRNQIHLMFWSSDFKKQPNFDLPISSHFEYKTDSCFNVKFLRAFGNREAAIDFKKKRRRIDNALYNEHRLHEKPYPKSKPNKKSDIPSDIQMITASKTRKNVRKTKQQIPDNNNNLITTNDVGSISPPSSPISVTHHAIANTISELEHGSEVDSQTDDIICITNRENFKRHRPFSEFDVVSGRFPFARTKNSNRVYSVKGRKFGVKKNILDRLIYYNKSPTSKNNVNIDKTFVELLLLSAFRLNDLKLNEIDEDVLNVIKGFYGNRVGRNGTRMKAFERYVQEKCNELRQNRAF